MDFIPGTYPPFEANKASSLTKPEYLHPLTTHPTIQQLTSAPLTTHLATLRTTYLEPYLIQPLSTLLVATANLSSTTTMPDLLSILLLAVILLVSLKILDYTRRMVLFWVSLAVRLLFWGALLGVGWYVYTVGVERAGREAGWVAGWVMGLVEDFQRGVGEGRGRERFT